jgi:hypothetical protein
MIGWIAPVFFRLGVEFARELADTPWGTREFMAKVCAGGCWCLAGTYPKARNTHCI